MSQIIPSGNQSLHQQDAAIIKKTLSDALQVPIKSNPYTAQITRDSPSAFLFLIDQSGSMAEQLIYNGETMSKADAVAKIINKLLYDIINRCKKAEGIRDYFDIALIGYGGNSAHSANLLWEGNLEGRDWVTISELDQNYISKEEVIIEKVIRGVVKRSPESVKSWIKPLAKYRTPMKPAFEMALTLVEEWIVNHSDAVCFPPLIMNITDGAVTDASEEEILHVASMLEQLHTADGNVLLMNIHISDKVGDAVLFPSNSSLLPKNNYAKFLYDLSSELPVVFHKEIAAFKHSDIASKYIAMAYNADMAALIQILNIGTATSKGV